MPITDAQLKEYYPDNSPAVENTAGENKNILRIIVWKSQSCSKNYGHAALVTFNNCGLEQELPEQYKKLKNRSGGIYVSFWPPICRPAEGCPNNTSSHFHTYNEDKKSEDNMDGTTIDLSVDDTVIEKINNAFKNSLARQNLATAEHADSTLYLFAKEWRIDLFSAFKNIYDRSAAQTISRCCSTLILNLLKIGFSDNKIFTSVFDNVVKWNKIVACSSISSILFALTHVIDESNAFHSPLTRAIAKFVLTSSAFYTIVQPFCPIVIITPHKLHDLLLEFKDKLIKPHQQRVHSLT